MSSKTESEVCWISVCVVSSLSLHRPYALVWFGSCSILYLATSYILIYLGFIMIYILHVHHHHDANI